MAGQAAPRRDPFTSLARRPPAVFSTLKVSSTARHFGWCKIYVKSCLKRQSIGHVQHDWGGIRQLSHFHSKPSSYMRFYARIDEKSEHPLGCENIANEEVFEGFGEDPLSSDTHSQGQGTLQGAVALIIGTSVGAGALALPARTMNAGFVPTLTTMGVSWCFLVIEALLLAEVNVALQKQHKNSSVLSLCAMTEKTLGPLGGTLSACIYISLSYTVMVAYIAKSGDILSPLLHMSPLLSCWIFTLVFGSLTLWGSTKLVDSFNQIMTSAMIGVFLLIITGGFAITDWKGLQHMDWGKTPETFPVIFFALVYHDLMPVLCTYLKGDIYRIRLAVLLGSVVPLIMFICWDAVILCIAPISGTEDPLDFLTRSGGTSIAIIIASFSILALATSFIGTLIGFTAFFKEALNRSRINKTNQLSVMEANVKLFERRITSSLSKFYSSNGTKISIFSRDMGFLYNGWISRRMQIVLCVLTLAPPLVTLSLVSNAFLAATNLAGGYGMTMLYGVLPPIMAWTLHERGLLLNKEKTGSVSALSRFQVHAVLAASGTFATGIIVSQLMLDFSS